ncbi:MAG: apolipoprotein N-acyltransferase [Clostridia bacterium]|nr:apolipoprotein N-acyltransferase [Clostridia bacterium]
MKKAASFFRHPTVWLLSSALLSALPQTFSCLFFLCFLSFVPFLLVLEKKRGEGSAPRAFLRGWLFGFIYYALIYYWFLWLYPLDFAGLGNGESLFVVCLAWLGISLCHGMLFALPSLGVHLAARWRLPRAFRVFFAAFLILCLQKITFLSDLAFPWVRVSLPLYRVPVLIQPLSLFGVDFLDFLVLAVNAAFALLLLSEGKKQRLVWGGIAVAILAADLLFGVVSLTRPLKGERVNVLSLQASAMFREGWTSSSLESYVAMTREETRPETELVVWPESAIITSLSKYGSLTEYLAALSKEVDSPILTGCFYGIEGKSANAAALLSEEGIESLYAKRHLVPFGEKMPYRAILTRLFPMLEELNILSADLYEGTEPTLFSCEKGQYGAIICFESLFPALTRDTVRSGAEMIVLVTNDSWYKDSPAAGQHLAHAVFRSVENGRSTVRSANSGISAVIDPQGRILSEMAALKVGALRESVLLQEELTLYTRLGDVFFPTALISFLGLGVILFFTERRRQHA